MTGTETATRSLVQAARKAAGEVADLKLQASRIDPYTPLAAWDPPLRQLDLALNSAANGLYRASQLAHAIGEDPARPEAGGAAIAFAVASTRVNHAADLTNGTIAAIRRELRRTETGRDVSPNPLSRHAAYAAECLHRLDDALLTVFRATTPDLAALTAALAATARQQATILADLSHTCDRFHYGVTEACERIPGTANSKVTRISGSLKRASTTLRKAGTGTARAAADLENELIRARRRAST